MEKLFRVNFVESERGWGQRYDTEHFSTVDEAVDVYHRVNDSLPDRGPNGSAPDYYFQAESVEGFDSHTMNWYTINPYIHRAEKEKVDLTKSENSNKVVEIKPQETDMNFPAFLDFLRKVAAENREIAAMGGEYHDNGAQALLDQIEIWTAGAEKRIPTQWKKHAQKFNRKNDPDYATFQKLKEKFGE